MKKLNDHAEPTKSKATKMLLSMGVVGRGDSVAFILSKKPLTIQPIHNHKA